MLFEFVMKCTTMSWKICVFQGDLGFVVKTKYFRNLFLSSSIVRSTPLNYGVKHFLLHNRKWQINSETRCTGRNTVIVYASKVQSSLSIVQLLHDELLSTMSFEYFRYLLDTINQIHVYFDKLLILIFSKTKFPT